MKTTVVEQSKNVYLVTFGFFEASKTMNISYHSMRNMFRWLISSNRDTDMYGRLITDDMRKQYNDEDHYDLAVSPDYVIRKGAMRIDSEEAIVSMRMEVLNPAAIGATTSELSLHLECHDWQFIPRCFYEYDPVESSGKLGDESWRRSMSINDRKNLDGYREYVGLPETKSYNWCANSGENGLRCNTLDLWAKDKIVINEEPLKSKGGEAVSGVGPGSRKCSVITFDETNTELVKIMLGGNFDFTINTGNAEVKFTAKKTEATQEKSYLDKHLKDFKTPGDVTPGYNGSTFTPEQPSDANRTLDDFPKLGGWKGVGI